MLPRAVSVTGPELWVSHAGGVSGPGLLHAVPCRCLSPGLDDIGSAGSISTAAILPEPLHTYMPLDRLLRPAKSGVVLLCGHKQFPSFQPVARRHAAMCSRFVCLHRPTLRRSAKWRRASWLSMNRRRPHVILALLSLCFSTWMQVECSCCSCSHLPNQCMIPAYLHPAVRTVGCWGVGQHAGES